MNHDRASVKQKIKQKIEQLARDRQAAMVPLADDTPIQETGLLDSVSLVRLIVWYEQEFDVSTDEEELTVDNFGTVDLMTDYLARNGSLAA